jgi:hypothetical protein
MKLFKILTLVLITVIAISCKKKEEVIDPNDFSSPEFQSKYMDIGGKIAEECFNTIRLKVISVMEEKGIPGAVEFCNVNAYPLTDSLSKALDAQIRRTSIRWRNPNNAPSKSEVSILEFYENQHLKGLKLRDSLIKISKSEVLFVRPIFAYGMCQNCHGAVGTTLQPENYDIIKKLYPEDKSIDYRSGDLRGMWSIKLKVKHI